MTVSLVVKVGGSLFDHPALFPGLRHWLKDQPAGVVLVPGGGGVADCVRAWDQVHQLGEGPAHRIALASLEASFALFQEMLPVTQDVPEAGVERTQGWSILNLREFAKHPDISASWAVTTDSLAAYSASWLQVPLVLLKSVTIPEGASWNVAAERGWVDSHFPKVVRKYKLSVSAVNFREYLEAFSVNGVSP